MIHYGSVRTTSRIHRADQVVKRDSSSGSLLSRRATVRLVPILQDASGTSGDHCRTRTFDFTYADQCELEDLLERTATGGRPLSMTLGDAATFPLGDGKDISATPAIGHRTEKDATEMATTLQELSESKVDEESSECDESEGWKRVSISRKSSIF